MSKSKISMIGLILSLFFSGIVCVALFLLWNLHEQPYFALKMVFTAVNLLLIIIFAGFSGALCDAITTPMFAGISVVSVIYTILQFTALAINFTKDTPKGFLLFQLILLFVYLAIVLPIAKMGYSLAHNKE